MKTQNEKIRKHLLNGKSITPLGALSMFGCLRLSGRIFDLRKSGLNINMRLITRNKKTFAEYRLCKG